MESSPPMITIAVKAMFLGAYATSNWALAVSRLVLPEPMISNPPGVPVLVDEVVSHLDIVILNQTTGTALEAEKNVIFIGCFPVHHKDRR